MAGRVLVIEDDASLARSIVNGLSDEGFTVAHAGDGDSARDALRGDKWDLVILDWGLPGPDGLAVLKGHRRESGKTPVLFLTARDAVSDRVSRTRRRRRRLSVQALCLRGADRPRPRLDPPRAPARSHDALVSRPERRSGCTEGRAGRPSPGPDGQGVWHCSSSSSAIRARSCRGRASTAMSGARITTSSPTRSTFTSTHFAASSRRWARG